MGSEKETQGVFVQEINKQTSQALDLGLSLDKKAPHLCHS